VRSRGGGVGGEEELGWDPQGGRPRRQAGRQGDNKLSKRLEKGVGAPVIVMQPADCTRMLLADTNTCCAATTRCLHGTNQLLTGTCCLLVLPLLLLLLPQGGHCHQPCRGAGVLCPGGHAARHGAAGHLPPRHLGCEAAGGAAPGLHPAAAAHHHHHQPPQRGLHRAGSGGGGQ
jgi:hypothetical protein